MWGHAESGSAAKTKDMSAEAQYKEAISGIREAADVGEKSTRVCSGKGQLYPEIGPDSSEAVDNRIFKLIPDRLRENTDQAY